MRLYYAAGNSSSRGCRCSGHYAANVISGQLTKFEIGAGPFGAGLKLLRGRLRNIGHARVIGRRISRFGNCAVNATILRRNGRVSPIAVGHQIIPARLHIEDSILAAVVGLRRSVGLKALAVSSVHITKHAHGHFGHRLIVIVHHLARNGRQRRNTHLNVRNFLLCSHGNRFAGAAHGIGITFSLSRGHILIGLDVIEKELAGCVGAGNVRALSGSVTQRDYGLLDCLASDGVDHLAGDDAGLLRRQRSAA